MKTNVIEELLEGFQLSWRLMLDPRVSTMLKALVPILGIGYFLFPIDLVPDVIPVLGQLDDVAVLILLTRLLINMAPQAVVDEYRSGSKKTAGAEPSADSYQSTGSTGSAGSNQDDFVDADFRVVDED
ncbi:MAG: DUF1232 domain-containing protein [Chloroflexota bacterium]|nr:DUF1232 domain-containing protein [Chloroflexota bacterium]